MQPNQIQPNNPQMSGDEVAASLAFATHLQDQTITPEAPQEAETAPGEEETVETTNDQQIDEKALKEEIMKDVKNTIKEEMSGLREEIKSALTEDEETD